jgi:4,5-dihydroxyphthalate decarboxylase
VGAAISRDTGSDEYPDLFPDPVPLEADWFRRTGIYPIHGTVVVREELLAKEPWLARALFAALTDAKDIYLERLRNGEADGPDDRRYRALSAIVGDPVPYGLAVNRPAIEALLRYTHQQGLIAERPPIDAFFVDPAAA